ncbi:MAG TPA: alpha/beta fold hydrolase [Ktedonobacterales bacterium]
MALDVELYRRTLYVPQDRAGAPPRRISVIDMAPPGATRTIVFIHGFGGRALQWIYQLSAFGQSVRVIAPDLRGHGQSDDPERPPVSMESLLTDLEFVLDELSVTQSILLVGHSFGGAIATEFALRHPERLSGVVLIAVPERFILQPGLRPLMTLPDSMLGSLPQRIGFGIHARVSTLRRLNDRAMGPWRGAPRFAQLRVPTLVILGHRDRVFAQEHYTAVPKSIPGAQQIVIPVSAHLVQLERAEAVNRAIKRFSNAQAQRAGDPSLSQPAQAATARLIEMPWLQAYDPDVPEQIPIPSLLVQDLLGNAAAELPEATALRFFSQHIHYGELDRLANRFASALLRLGLRSGDRVAIILPNVPQGAITYFGTLRAGGVVVMGSPLSTEEELAGQLRDAGARVVVTLSAYEGMLRRIATSSDVDHLIMTDVREYLPLRERLMLAVGLGTPPSIERPALPAQDANGARPAPRTHALQDLLRRASAAPLAQATRPDDIALIQYTSGTTDAPRGVMLTHRNLMTNVAQVRHWITDAKRGKEVILAVLPLSHSYGLTNCLHLGMAIGATLVLLPSNRTEEILRAIRANHPTIFPGVPTMYLAVASFPHVRRYGISSVRVCVSGSAPLPVEVQEAFEKLTKGRLVEGYGLTEASPSTHANPLRGERRVGSIGIPLPSTEARIVDADSGAPVPLGEVGELVIRGPQVMKGYWQRPQDTAQAITPDGWLRTGDLARQDEDGYFTVVDRKKDLILAGRFNVYPRDVEEVLYEHPKVFEAVVVGEPGEEGPNSLIKAFVVLRRGERATAEELLALCRERLEAYKVPKQIEFRQELPKNLLGKVLRRLLIDVPPANPADAAAQATPATPPTPQEVPTE